MCLQETHNRIAECIHSALRLSLTGPVTLVGLIMAAKFCSTFQGTLQKQIGQWNGLDGKKNTAVSCEFRTVISNHVEISEAAKKDD